MVAVGAQDVALPVPGADGANVVSSWDVLAGNASQVEGRVAVIGGGLVGTETAEYLIDKGCKVEIVEMLDKIAAGESATILPTITAEFEKAGVGQHVNTRLVAIDDAGVQVESPDGPANIEADWVVMAVGSKKLPFETDGVGVPVSYVGDCSGERTADIASAIRSAYNAANEL